MPVTEAERSCIVNLIGSINPSQFKGLTTKIKFLYPAIYGKIKKFQDRKNIKTFSEVLYLVINGMDDVPKCCGISDRCLGKLRFKSINDGYFNHCKMCSSLSEDFKLKRFETNIDRYGVRYPTQCKMVLEKTVLTNLKRYNVKNVKQIKKESEEKMRLHEAEKKVNNGRRVRNVDSKTPLTRRFHKIGGSKKRSAITTSFQIRGQC